MTSPPDDRTNGRDQRSTTTKEGGADHSTQQGTEQPAHRERTGPAGWFAYATIRTGVIIVGFVLFLFALGQAVGFPLLDLFLDAVTSQTGRWIVVAILALLLIAAASRGLNRPIFGN